MILHQGGTIVVPARHPRSLDPDDIWRTIERERVGTLTIVGDAFARPLLDQLAQGALRPLVPAASSAPAARSSRRR